MIKYRQLAKGSGKTRKNLWYISGDDPALISDALDIAKEYINSGVLSICLGIFSGSDNLDDLTSFIQRPYYEERKIIIVHDASKHKSLYESIDLKDSSTFYVLVDYESNIAPEGLLKILTNNSKTRSIDCSNPSDDDMKLLVNSRLNISKTAANILVSRSNGDCEWLLNKVKVLELFNVKEVTQRLVDLICTDSGIAPFENSLIQFDKQQCFLYINSTGTEDIKISRIIKSIHNLSLLNAVSGEYKKQVRPISDKTGLSKNKVDKYIDKVPYYDNATSKRCFNSVMKIYNKLIIGDRLAYISLVCGW